MKVILILFSLTCLSLFSEFSFVNAFAYIDPGSGSVIIQMVVGALVGVGIAVKVFWVKIKLKLLPSLKKNNTDDEI